MKTKEETLRQRSENKTFQVVEKILEKIEVTLQQTEIMDSQAIRQLTAAVKDLKDIQMIRSEAEAREQEAKIAKLQKETREEQSLGGIRVVLEGELENYGK